MNLAAIVNKKASTWLKLAGIGEVHIIEEETEPCQILHSLWIREDVSVIIITPALSKSCQDQITEMMKEKIYPIIVEIPTDELGAKESTDTLKVLLRQTVGIELEF